MENTIENNQSAILFDGVCRFCNTVIKFVSAHDKKNTFTIMPLQTREARLQLRKTGDVFINLGTIYYIENGVSYKRSEAIFRIFRKLSYPWKFFSWFSVLPVVLTDYFYNVIARNRYKWFGKTDDAKMREEKQSTRYIPA